MQRGSRLAQRAQALGDPIERIVSRLQRGQRLADHVHDVAGVGLVAAAASAEETAEADESARMNDAREGTLFGWFHVLDQLALHGGVQFDVVNAAKVMADDVAIRAVDAAQVVGHPISATGAFPHAVRLHRDRDDARVLLRIVSVDLVADDRVEARDRLVDQLLFHRITSTGRAVARGAGPSSWK